MAKLEERVTPSELLDEIRAGALKPELIKRYRTSEQELAMTLHDLYRKGSMTKEEFNDFFKGIPIRHSDPRAEPTSKEFALKPEYDSPSQILRTITAAEDRQSGGAETLGENGAATPAPPSAPTAELTREVPDEPRSEPEHDQAAGTQPASISAPVPTTPEEAVSAESLVELDPEVESSSLESLLRTISATINSIDSRLSNIEKKLGLS
jgi:hypothetical protein